MISDKSEEQGRYYQPATGADVGSEQDDAIDARAADSHRQIDELEERSHISSEQAASMRQDADTRAEREMQDTGAGAFRDYDVQDPSHASLLQNEVSKYGNSLDEADSQKAHKLLKLMENYTFDSYDGMTDWLDRAGFEEMDAGFHDAIWLGIGNSLGDGETDPKMVGGYDPEQHPLVKDDYEWGEMPPDMGEVDVRSMHEEALDIIEAHTGSDEELLSKVAYLGFPEDQAIDIIKEEQQINPPDTGSGSEQDDLIDQSTAGLDPDRGSGNVPKSQPASKLKSPYTSADEGGFSVRIDDSIMNQEQQAMFDNFREKTGAEINFDDKDGVYLEGLSKELAIEIISYIRGENMNSGVQSRLGVDLYEDDGDGTSSMVGY
jgi:hypothetical protein